MLYFDAAFIEGLSFGLNMLFGDTQYMLYILLENSELLHLTFLFTFER